jgi:hypothetical protein
MLNYELQSRQSKFLKLEPNTLADLLYTFLMRKVMLHIHNVLKLANLTTPIPWAGSPGLQFAIDSPVHASVSSVTFVDDAAFPMSASSGDQIITKLVAVTSVITDVFTGFGLVVNFGTNKTEAVLNIRGNASLKWKRKVFCSNKGVLEVPTNHSGTQKLTIAAQYKRLGTILSQADNMQAEIASRTQQTFLALRPLRRKIFGNPSISKSTKTQLLQSLLLSKMLFHSPIWPVLRVGESKRLQTAIMSVYRAAAGMQTTKLRQDHYSDTAVLVYLGAASPEELLKIARLRYLQRILRKAPHQLWAVLHAETAHKDSWLISVLDEDLKWVYDLVGPEVLGITSRFDEEGWESIMIRKGNSWKNVLVSAIRTAVQYRELAHGVFAWQTSFIQQLKTAGIAVPSHLIPDWSYLSTLQAVRPKDACLDNRADQVSTCPECNRAFAGPYSAQALGRHLWQEHSRRAELRYYIHGTTCEA